LKNFKPDSGACPGLDPGFVGVREIGKAWFLVVIPAEAGIQDEPILFMGSYPLALNRLLM
jgi:hypothetical protein